MRTCSSSSAPARTTPPADRRPAPVAAQRLPERAVRDRATRTSPPCLPPALLFFLAAGPVRGFGVTLSIGVVASMLSALVVTRVLAEFLVSRVFVLRHPRLSGIAGTAGCDWLEARRPSLMKHSRRAGIAVAIVVAVARSVAVRGLNLGIEFTGGRLLEVSTAQRITPDQARAAVAEAGFRPRSCRRRAPTTSRADRDDQRRRGGEDPRVHLPHRRRHRTGPQREHRPVAG